eukprot:m.159247 g.159247  ORF g.159247 m.159247 type:complete len:353 (+) comp13366_c4_seq3:5533-6591(+)
MKEKQQILKWTLQLIFCVFLFSFLCLSRTSSAIMDDILARVDAAIQEQMTLSNDDMEEELGIGVGDGIADDYEQDALLKQVEAKLTRPNTTGGRRKRGTAKERHLKHNRATTAATTRTQSKAIATTSQQQQQSDMFKGDALLEAVDKGDVVGDAAVRILKAKLAVAMEENEVHKQEGEELRKQLNSMKSEVKSNSKDALKEKKAVSALQKEIKQLKRKLNDVVAKLETEKEKNAVLHNEVSTLRKESKQSNNNGSDALSVRLNRAIEERDSLKAEVKKLKAHRMNATTADEDAKSLQAKCKQLTLQRDEALSAFEKALKLVDVLKKQKVHMEAARVLAFTEEEFVRTLDWNE